MYKEKLDVEKKKLKMLEAELDMVTSRRDWVKAELEGFIGMDKAMASFSKDALEEDSKSVSDAISKLIVRSEEVGRVKAEIEKQKEEVGRLEELCDLEGER